jgi:hypothetical protein
MLLLLPYRGTSLDWALHNDSVVLESTEDVGRRVIQVTRERVRVENLEEDICLGARREYGLWEAMRRI